MEFTRRYLPMEWEEKWRREKERRKRVIEEGGEGMEEDNRQLRRIVAFNDSRLGMAASKVEKRSDSVDSQGLGTEEPCDEVLTYRRQGFSEEVFQAMWEFRASSVLTDLTLSTDDGASLQAHSSVLAAVSSLVRQKLRETDAKMKASGGKGGVCKGTEEQGWSITLGPEVDHVGLEAILEFAYTGALATLSRDTLAQIEAAALMLGVPRVVDLCTEMEDRIKVGGGQKKERKVSASDQMEISLQSIRELWTERVGCDVTLEAEGEPIHVHRVILAASSDYFRGMFTSGMRESQQPRISLPYLLASELEILIGCSYSGALSLGWGCVFEITCLALQLQFQHALLLCFDFMQKEMDASSCLDVASFAEAYGMPDLLEQADDFVLRNFQDVSATGKFRDLPGEKLLGFLRCDGLCVPSELAVFRAAVAWVESDPDERLGLAGELMTGVRFPLMTFREFREVRAINLRMECSGSKDIELYKSALSEFGFNLSESQDRYRVRHPKDVLVLVGGDRLNPDGGQRLPSKELWFANSLRSGTGLVKGMEWRRLGEMPQKPRFRHGVAVMRGKLYVVGGCDYYTKDDTLKCAYRYDPTQGSWQRLADMQEFRSNFPLVMCGERLYAIGGDKEINTNIDTVEAYDPDSDSWRYVQPLDQTLSGHAVTVLEGQIFISGGLNCKYVCLVSMFLYHPERGPTYLADMTHDRAQHCMEALRGRLYVAGGVCNLRKFYTNRLACEVYDPVTDTWSAIAPLPLPHVGAACAVLEEKVYILGGYCQEDYSESGLVHRYDTSMQRWESMGRMPGAITDIKACLLSLPKQLRQ